MSTGCPICNCPIHGNPLRCTCQGKKRREMSEQTGNRLRSRNEITKTKISGGKTNDNRYSSYSNKYDLKKTDKKRKSITKEKYEYGEKVKEKKNYILYVSGIGYVQKEVEEEEQKTDINKKKEEETKLKSKPTATRSKKEVKVTDNEEQFSTKSDFLDNYKYYERKEVKKFDPRRSSVTIHKRHGYPFEEETKTTTTKVRSKKYGSLSEEPKLRREEKTTEYNETYNNICPIHGTKGSYNEERTETRERRVLQNAPPRPRPRFNNVQPLFREVEPERRKQFLPQPRVQYTPQTRLHQRREERRREYEYNQRPERIEQRYEERREYMPQPQIRRKEIFEKDYQNPHYRSKRDISLEEYYGARQIGEAMTKTQTTQDGDYLIRVTTTRREMEREPGYGRGIEVEEERGNLRTRKDFEEDEYIDNYKYKETKDIKNPKKNRLSITYHQRKDGPFLARKGYSRYTEENLRSVNRKTGQWDYERSASEYAGRRNRGGEEEVYEFYCPVHGRRSIRSFSQY